MEVDGDERGVGPGDAILIPPRAWHEIRADDDGELRFLCCCAPPYSDEDTFFE
jgi:mannose-6-phosphate isomerase-like protein (cupin superfamily)